MFTKLTKKWQKKNDKRIMKPRFELTIDLQNNCVFYCK